MVLRKCCCYKSILRYLANIFYCCSRCTSIFPGYFWVNLIFTKRSRNSPDIDAVYLPTFRAAARVYTCQWGEFVFTASVTWFNARGDCAALTDFYPLPVWFRAAVQKFCQLLQQFGAQRCMEDTSNAGAFLRLLSHLSLREIVRMLLWLLWPGGRYIP